MTTLTGTQENLLFSKIESLRGLHGKKALIKNDAIFKFLCARTAHGFIDRDEYERWDRLRFEALMKIRRE